MLVAAAGASPSEAFPGGIVVVRAAEYLAGARGSLTVTDPDAQATSGKSVSDTQTAANLAAADDTLTIPFTDLPLRFGIDYRMHVFYRDTGAGPDDGKQHLTARFVYAWGFQNPFTGTRGRTAGPLFTDAVETTPLSRERDWFGALELGDFAYAVDPADSLDLAFFKSSGSGAIIIDQVVFVPAQEVFVDAPYVYTDLAGGGPSPPSPWPDHVVRVHDETDLHQGDSIASYYQAADGIGAEIMQVDPATFIGDFVIGGRYDAYALGAVHILEGETLLEDHFGRNVYKGWGTPDTGAAWVNDPDHPSASFVGPEGTTALPAGDWDGFTNYLIGDLVEGSDGLGYISKVHPNGGHDPTLDLTHTFWDDLTGGDVGIIGTTAVLGVQMRSPISYDDARISAKVNSSIVLAQLTQNPSDGYITWWPFGLALRGSTTSLAAYWALAELDPSGNMSLVLWRTAHGGYLPGETVLGGPISIATPYVANDWYQMRFEAVGATFRAKMWKDGDTEPDWQIEEVDNGLNVGDGTQFDYMYGRPGCLSRVGYGRTGGTVENGYTRWDDVVIERLADPPEEAHLALARTGTGAVVLQDAVESNRNWAWHYLGAALVWPSPGVAGLDLVGWNPLSASEWQRVGAQALFFAFQPTAVVLEIEFRAERHSGAAADITDEADAHMSGVNFRAERGGAAGADPADHGGVGFSFRAERH